MVDKQCQVRNKERGRERGGEGDRAKICLVSLNNKKSFIKKKNEFEVNLFSNLKILIHLIKNLIKVNIISEFKYLILG